MGLFGKIKKAFKKTPVFKVGKVAFKTAKGVVEGVVKGPQFPDIPPVSIPPPPIGAPQAPPRARPPLRDDPALDEAEGRTRDLFRRRGRASTLLTRGRGAGVRRGSLGATRRL